MSAFNSNILTHMVFPILLTAIFSYQALLFDRFPNGHFIIIIIFSRFGTSIASNAITFLWEIFSLLDQQNGCRKKGTQSVNESATTKQHYRHQKIGHFWCGLNLMRYKISYLIIKLWCLIYLWCSKSSI